MLGKAIPHSVETFELTRQRDKPCIYTNAGIGITSPSVKVLQLYIRFKNRVNFIIAIYINFVYYRRLL